VSFLIAVVLCCMDDSCVSICKAEVGNRGLKVYTLTHTHEFLYMGMYKYLHIFVLVYITFGIVKNQFLIPT
jgi:hypothetical protein